MDDVRSVGQLLEGLHRLLELVRPLRVHLCLVKLLLHPTNAQHAVDVVRSQLLASLTDTDHLLAEARDPLTDPRRLLLRAETRLDTGQAQLRPLKTEVTRRLCALNTKL